MMKLLFAGASLAALCCANAAFAQQQAADPDVTSDAATVAEVVATATRSPQSVSRIGSSVSVIDAEQIKERQAPLIGDLLIQTPGVSMTRNGGPGATATINIRGAEGHHTVVIIDGVKLNDPSAPQGGFSFGNLLTGDVSRIEVLRGAQSTLWGSQAIGGVVNIVTAEPEPGFAADVTAEAGQRDTQYLRLGVSGGSERASVRLAGGLFHTGGFSSFAAGTEKDGYDNAGVSGRFNAKLTETASLDVRAVYSDGENEFDGFAGDSAEFGKTKELVAYTGLNLALMDGRFRNRLGYAYTDTDRKNYDPTLAPDALTFAAVGQNRRLEYQGSFAIAEGYDATFGAETEHSRFRTASFFPGFPSPPALGRSRTDSVYAQVQGDVLPGLTLTGGIRYDDHDVFGGQTLGQAAAAWTLNDGATVVRASFGQGFRAPSLYELFSEYGNTTLRPEDADSWDASISQRLLDGDLVLSATYFGREATNEINFFSCFAPTTDPLCAVGGIPRFGYYANVQETKAKGVELAAEYQATKAFSLSANYTITEAEFAAGSNIGNQLVRRPKQMGNLHLNYTWPNDLVTTASVRYVGEVFTNASNTARLDSYVVVDLRGSYPVADKIEIFGRVENLFDEDYRTVPNFGTAGRGAFAGVRARF